MDWINFLLTPVVAAIVGLAVWFVQSRVELVRRERDKLHDERRKIYSDVLDPYIRAFSGIKDPQTQAEILQKITSHEYRKTSFEFALLASDDVVKAFNQMMQYFFTAEAEGGAADPIEMLKRWGGFLLEIRKNIGDPRTGLSEIDMLRGHITDIDRTLGHGK